MGPNELAEQAEQLRKANDIEVNYIHVSGECLPAYTTDCSTGDCCCCSCTCDPYDVDELVDLLRVTVRASVDQDERDIADKFKKLVEILYE